MREAGLSQNPASDQVVQFVLRLCADSTESADDLWDGLQHIAAHTHHERGCSACAVELNSDWTVRFTEEWTTERDMQRPMRSDLFRAILELIEQSAQKPNVEFDVGVMVRDLDYAQQVKIGALG